MYTRKPGQEQHNQNGSKNIGFSYLWQENLLYADVITTILS